MWPDGSLVAVAQTLDYSHAAVVGQVVVWLVAFAAPAA
jgi:hypothetical protein